jgi:hypothetical protein
MKEIGGQPVGRWRAGPAPAAAGHVAGRGTVAVLSQPGTLPVVDEATGKLVGVMSYWDALAAASSRKA